MTPVLPERRIILLVALVQLVNVIDFMMVMPLGPDFAKALGIDESHLGYIGGSYVAAAAVAGLVSSRFLDRFDRRAALAVAMAGLVIATAAGGFATSMGTLIMARVLAGIFGGPATSLSLAIVADVVPQERRGRAMGTVMAAFSVASVLGVPAGLALADAGSWRTPFFALAVSGLVVTAAAIFLMPSLRLHLADAAAGRPRHQTSTRALLRRPEIALAMIASGAMTMSIFLVVPNLSTFVQHNLGYPRAHLDILYLVGGAVAFIVLRVTGPTVDRIGSTPVATLGTAMMMATLAVSFLGETSLIPVLLIFVLFMASNSIRAVPVSTLTSRLPSPTERAQFMSLQSAIQHLASAAGAFLGAQLLAKGTDGKLLHMPLVASLAISTAAIVPLLIWRVELRVRARLAGAR